MSRPGRDPHAAARKRIVRQATLYSLAFAAAGLVIAVAGAALIAWLLARVGMPFRTTWLVVTAIIVLPGLIAALWNSIRNR